MPLRYDLEDLYIWRVTMSRFDVLTKYILLIPEDSIGEWVVDNENDGTPEHPIQFPYVDYSEMVHNFIKDVYAFGDEFKDIGLTQYGIILEENGIGLNITEMKKADVSKFDSQGVLALIMGALRADRFCEGDLLSFFKNGCILKWLKRLDSIE